MKQIPLSQQGKNAGKYFALVDDEDFEYLSKFKWRIRIGKNTFYAVRSIFVNGKEKIVRMHNTVLKCPPGSIPDHRDGNGLNNQKSNLRIATISENNMNRKAKRNSVAGFKGITFDKCKNKFKAVIRSNNKTYSLGYHDTPIEAAEAYNKKAIELHGQFAKLNQLDGVQ